MGVENRQYYRDDESGSNWGSSWRPAAAAGRSIVITLIMINFGIFVLDMFSASPINSGAAGNNGVLPAEAGNQINPLMRFLALESTVYMKPWNLWTLLSHGFAHASINSNESIFHIGSNMLVLFFLGRPLEQRLGSNEFLKFYLVAIVLSGIGYVVLNIASPYSRAVGASGAVSAVVALFVFLYPKQTLLLFGVLPMPAWVLGVFIVLTDVMRAFDPASVVAWESHLTGFAFGAAYFYFNLRFDWLKLEKIKELFSSRPKLKVHRMSNDEKIKQQADEILEKINVHGEESLSARERGILKKYSEQIRNQRN